MRGRLLGEIVFHNATHLLGVILWPLLIDAWKATDRAAEDPSRYSLRIWGP